MECDVVNYTLEECRKEMDRSLEPRDIIGKLISLHVITAEDEDLILNTSPSTRRTRAGVLWNIIQGRGDPAFNALLIALREARYIGIVEKLEKCLQSKGAKVRETRRTTAPKKSTYPVQCTDDSSSYVMLSATGNRLN